MPLNDCVAVSFEVEVLTLPAPPVMLSGATLTQGDVQIPALSAIWLDTDVTNPYLLGIEFEYQGVSLSTGVVRVSALKDALSLTATSGIVSGKTYSVRYRSVGDGVYGPWTAPASVVMPDTFVAGSVVDQGDLATEDQVTTPVVNTGALARITYDQTIGSSVTIPTRGTPPGYSLIKTMDFEIDEPDSIITVTISFAYESANANNSWIWLKIGQTAPVWVFSGSADMTNADALYYVSDYNGPATSIYTFTGLPVGTNTMEIYGGSTGSGSHSNKAKDTYFGVREDKKAL